MLGRRSQPLKKQSTRQGTARARQQQAYRVVDAESEAWCLACGCSGPLDHSHILTQKQHPKHRANPLNLVRLCRACHTCWEDKKAQFKLRYPEAFAEKMRRMQLIDAQAYAVFRMKWAVLFPGG